jgi:hypothetical protein
MAHVLRNRSDAFRGTLASFLVLACLHSPSWAEESASQNLPFRSQWVHVPSVDESRDFYLDRSSVRVVEGDVEAWDVVIYKNPSQRDPSSGRLIKQKRTYRRSSCIRSDQALLKGSIFDEEGKLIELITQPYEKAPKVLIPYGTIAWSQLVLACEIAGLPAPQLPGNGLKAPVSGVE